MTDEVVEPPVAGTEAATLLGSLERQRATFAWKVGGLDAAALATRLEPSAMTLGGLLKHLAFVEELRFTTLLQGEPPSPVWDPVDREGGGEWPWLSAAQDAPGDLYALWRETVVRSRASVERALADGGLDARVAYLHGSSDPSERPSLRRLVVDTIEEYARHVGHADLLREAVDGLVGEDPPGQTYPFPPVPPADPEERKRMNHVAAPENAGAEDVVARRELRLDGRDVTLVVGAARPFADDETDVFCPVRLEESDGTAIWSSRAGGVDAVQALLLALTAAGDRLAQHDGEVTFLGGRELSLPLTTGSTGRRTVATFAHGSDDPDAVPVASASLQG